jgi:bifunctional DNA-binding transcriptional regulator/antitoxin component of YhaV-PrlF toxin-antitoxin module
MTTIVIDATGWLEIPLEIRQQLGLTTTQELVLEVSNGQIILQPLSPIVRYDGTAQVLETPPLGNLSSLINDLREERIRSQLPT